jgi:LysM repeat protein
LLSREDGERSLTVFLALAVGVGVLFPQVPVGGAIMTPRHSLLIILVFFLPTTVFAATRYIVKKGDSLYKISKRFKVPASALREVNKLSNDRLDIGDVLLIPDSDAKKVSLNQEHEKKASVDKSQYVVAKGDTLVEISKKFGISVEDIKRANNLKNNKLQIGQKLIVPASGPTKIQLGNSNRTQKEISVSKAVVEEKNQAETKSNLLEVTIRYIVKDGDTLGKIASNFGVPIGELKRANGLKDDKLKIGMVLSIPGSGNSKVAEKTTSQPVLITKRYAVKRGDNLYELAKKFGTSVEVIKKTNRLNSDRLDVGDVLFIPDSKDEEILVDQEEYRKKGVTASKSVGEKKPVESKSNLSSVPIEYRVKKGDTLSGIANKFGVSVNALKNANGLKSNNIRIGMRLTIPGAFSTSSSTDLEVSPDTGESKNYTVKKGDTLGLIAKKFKIPVKDLKRANNIRGNTIKVGQVLTIPAQEREEGIYKTQVRTSSPIETDDNHYYRNNDNHKKDDYITRDTIISVAKRFLGAPYKFGGNSLIKGIDCSGFVNKVFSFFNVDLPRTARDMYKVGQDVDRDELTTGDLVFFRTYAQYPSHVGIYIEDSKFIHASSAAKRVTIDSINESYYRKRYIGAKRIDVKGLFYDEMSKDYKGFERQLN